MCQTDMPLHVPTAIFNNKLTAFNWGRVLIPTVVTIY